MGKIRATNHHGRGRGGRAYSPRHIDRHELKEAKHIDPDRTPQNRYWLWRGEWQGAGDCEAAEREYYNKAFAAGQEAQNERYRRKGNYSRVRTTDQVYECSTTSPEGSLLYIGALKDGRVDPDVLWQCAMEYREWEAAESENAGGFYKLLSMAMHVDEEGQFHIEERGVYQYRDAAGNLRPGQNAALEAAGIPLPDDTKPRDRTNNRKMVWDAARREKWLDVLEAHGFDVERVPEKERPHMGLNAWKAWKDAQAELDTQAAKLREEQAAFDDYMIKRDNWWRGEYGKLMDKAASITDADKLLLDFLKNTKAGNGRTIYENMEETRRKHMTAAPQVARPKDPPPMPKQVSDSVQAARKRKQPPTQPAAVPESRPEPRPAPAPDLAAKAAAQAAVEAAQAEQKRLQELWEQRQAGKQYQGPGFGG